MIEWKAQKLAYLRRKLHTGESSIGGWQQINNCEVAEILAVGDYDWVTIDWEHGRFTESSLLDIVRAHEVHGMLSFIRVPELTAQNCKICMETGAAGAIFPMIETSEQAATALSLLRWPPAGSRGVGFSRANTFGEFFELSSELNNSPFVVFMIETVAGVENLDSILQQSRPDAIFIGPYDLSASLGQVGDFESRDFLDSLEKIQKTCARHSVQCGLHVIQNNREELDARKNQGFNFLAFSLDSVILRESVFRMETI